MDRITEKMLQGLCDSLNRITGAPMTPYTKDADGKYRANIGNYHLDGAYGGWCIVRMHNDGGGIDTPIFGGHRTKREAFELGHAYLNGLRGKKTA